jgi:hypothetical protein
MLPMPDYRIRGQARIMAERVVRFQRGAELGSGVSEFSFGGSCSAK